MFTLHSLLYQDRLYTFSLFFVIICFTSLLFSCTMPAQRFELWTLKLRVSCSTKLSYTGDFQDLSCNAPDVIRTRDIRVKSPLPYRLATDANLYSVFGISPSVFVLFFSLLLILLFIFLYVHDINVGNINWHGGTRTHDTLVNGQALYLAELRANISLRAKPSPANHIQLKPYAKWSIRESNPPPPACKTGVAPLRLIPHIRRQPSCRHI